MRSSDSPSQDAPVILKALAFKFRISAKLSCFDLPKGGGGGDMSLVREGGVFEVGERKESDLVPTRVS